MNVLRVVAVSVAAIAALAAIAFVLERDGTIDRDAVSIRWGGGKAPPAGEDMVLISAGTYWIGDDSPHRAPDAPLRQVRLRAFLIDRHEVTNREFAHFVSATGYRTTAEREGGGWVYRGGKKDWTYIRDADWRHPLGSDTSIDHALDHPVVLVSWDDAAAYAKWAGKRLPSEAEWEVAARAGTAPAARDTRQPAPQANYWQGKWPKRNLLTDGFFYTAPVGSFPANPLGLHDMIGNVWEWTADLYDSSNYLRVARGGSWFCSPNYCSAYRPGFRGKSPQSHAFNNVGFRCARDAGVPHPP